MDNKYMTNCKTCGREVAKSARRCPHCGACMPAHKPSFINEKRGKQMMKRRIALLVSFALALGCISGFLSPAAAETQSGVLPEKIDAFIQGIRDQGMLSSLSSKKYSSEFRTSLTAAIAIALLADDTSDLMDATFLNDTLDNGSIYFAVQNDSLITIVFSAQSQSLVLLWDRTGSLPGKYFILNQSTDAAFMAKYTQSADSDYWGISSADFMDDFLTILGYTTEQLSNR